MLTIGTLSLVTHGNFACGWGLIDQYGLLPLKFMTTDICSVFWGNSKPGSEIIWLIIGLWHHKKGPAHTTCVTKPLYYSSVFLISNLWKQKSVSVNPLAKGESECVVCLRNGHPSLLSNSSKDNVLSRWSHAWGALIVLWFSLAWRVGTLRCNILSILSLMLTLLFSSLNLQLSAFLGVSFWKPFFVANVWTGRRHWAHWWAKSCFTFSVGKEGLLAPSPCPPPFSAQCPWPLPAAASPDNAC